MNELAFHNFFIDRIQYLYWAEKHWVDSLLIIKKIASSDDLKSVFQYNADQIQIHINRIEKIFDLLDEEIKHTRCKTMADILNEITLVISKTDDKTSVRDAALIIVAKKAIQYEIAAYGKLIEFSKIMGNIDVSQLLFMILEEEMEINQKLSELADRSIDDIVARCR